MGLKLLGTSGWASADFFPRSSLTPTFHWEGTDWLDQHMLYRWWSAGTSEEQFLTF